MESDRFQTRCPCCGRIQNGLSGPSPEPLVHVYAFQGKQEELCKLLSRGVDPNVMSDASMACPLHRAAETGMVACAQALVAHGADVNARDSGGRTPLHVAAEHQHLDFIQLMLAKGADRRCSTGCRKCTLYSKLALKREKKLKSVPMVKIPIEEYESEDEELDFLQELKKLKAILKGKVINRKGEVVAYR